MANAFLYRNIDNGSLTIFRVFFGLLISAECYGAIFTGWVKTTLIEPAFTFSFIGFEWLQPLPGNGMYYYFAVMGTLGLLIALGYRYRMAMLGFALMWWSVYLMQKTSYNNHYYLLALLASIMVFLPANRRFSLDAKYNPKLWTNHMPAYVRWLVIAQLIIVYTYASLAKLYPDWLDASVIGIFFRGKVHYPIVGEFLQQTWLHYFIAYSGILFDLLIVPALLWKPSRKPAFILAVFFHLFNSIIFQIGIFPYLALAFTVFFFDAQTINRIFFKGRNFYNAGGFFKPAPTTKSFLLITSAYLLVQLFLPLRHHLIPGKVLWTEEGHRLSWRMMLRARSGQVQFTVVDKRDGKKEKIDLKEYLTTKQQRRVAAYPDFMWQFAQHLKKEAKAKGKDVAVYAKAKVSINGRRPSPFTDPDVDLAQESWSAFRHHSWILPAPF